MNSKDITAKPVVVIRTGKVVGKIRYPIVDSMKQEVVGFIVDDEKWYLETKVVLFALIRGMSNDVVTVEDDSAVMPSSLGSLQRQLQENVQIIGHKVISEDGRLLGFVEEFSFNAYTGKIESYKIKNYYGAVTQQDVISIGKDLMVIQSSMSQAKETVKETITRTAAAVEEPGNYNLNSVFERRQMDFALGKRLLRRIESDEGTVIAREGEIVNRDLIQRAKKQGKFTELVMSLDNQDIGM